MLDFWFEFASTYSYVAAMRIEEECARAGVEVRWKPFLLGPIFAEQLGIRDCHWVGTSMGGALGIRLAARELRRRIQRLVLNDSGLAAAKRFQ